MDAHKNFAYSTVVTAPSPASSGTSLVVTTGQGALFPAVPFNATVWPAGQQPTTLNAEIIRVTNVSTDTLTIVRAQESSSARSIIVTDQIAAGITVKTITDVETAISNLNSGWIPATETWAWVSADDPTFVFDATGDVRTVYSAGMRLRMINGGNTIYGIITNVNGTLQSGNTRITFLAEINSASPTAALYALADSVITLPSYSSFKVPFGFPAEQENWSIKVTYASNASQNSPSANTWYNLGTTNSQIIVPIGSWILGYDVDLLTTANSATGTVDVEGYVTLSKANNSADDNEYTSYVQARMYESSATARIESSLSKKKSVTLASKTTYYLNASTASSSIASLSFHNANDMATPMVLKAICAYL